MKLINIKDKFILVSDEEIKEGWSGYAYKADVVGKIFKHFYTLNEWYNDAKIVIAGIPELPSIDFSDLKEEDCKKIGFVDVVELSRSKYTDGSIDDNTRNDWRMCWVEGFKKAQELNDKRFSDEDMRKAILMGRIRVDNISPKYAINEIIQSLQQISWDVEVEMETLWFNSRFGGIWQPFPDETATKRKPVPKITNGKIKVIKIL